MSTKNNGGIDLSPLWYNSLKFIEINVGKFLPTPIQIKFKFSMAGLVLSISSFENSPYPSETNKTVTFFFYFREYNNLFNSKNATVMFVPPPP